MTDRIEEIKASIAGYDDIDNDSLITAKGVAGLVVDAKFLLGEIERLKMMLDAATSGQETMQKQWAADVAERDAAIFDLTIATNCDTCGNNNTSDCHIEAETGGCNYEWRGVQK